MNRAACRVALAQYPITFLKSWAEYRAKLTDIAASARNGGAALLVLPEYGSMELASLLPAGVSEDLHAQLDGMQALAIRFVELHAELAATYGLHLLASSFPTRGEDGAVRNRAWLLAPDGSRGYQDKLQMTRFERERWGIQSGSEIRVFDTVLGRIGVAICYDAEFPLIVRRQAEAGAEIILVPSCTDTLAGYWRVRIASQARALENQCFVVQAPTVGMAPWSAAVDVNVGAAGAFGPIDTALSSDGILMLGELDRPGLVFADLDPAALARIRAGGEVFNDADWNRQLGPASRDVLVCPISLVR